MELYLIKAADELLSEYNGLYGSQNRVEQNSGFSFQNVLDSAIGGNAENQDGLSSLSSSGLSLLGLMNGIAGTGTTLLSSLYTGQGTGVTSISGGMGASSGLVKFVESHEGFSSVPYNGQDYWNSTVGYGHVIQPGENIGYLSQADAQNLLTKDLEPCVESVNKEFSGTGLSQNQFDALVSLSYNLGTNVWDKAPKLTADIKSHASADAIQSDFLALDHVGGSVSQGLYNRRSDEFRMFESGQY